MMKFLLIIFLASCGGAFDPTTITEPGEFNYFVMIWYRGKFRCGGTIIDQRHIMTRGTCVRGVPSSDLSIIAGTVDTQILETKPLKVESVHIHYGFSAVCDLVIPGEIHWIHDISVLKLVNRMVRHPLTAPAVLITGEFNRNKANQCVVPGWRHVYKYGSSEKLYSRWNKAITYTDDDCTTLGVHLLKNERCAQWNTIYHNATHYYSASPVVCGNTVIGIVDGRKRGKYYAFLNLLPYEDFIANAIDDRKYDVSLGEVKYVVSIWDRGSFKCGGMILDASHILTTGSCVRHAKETELKVVAGHTQVLGNNPQVQWLSVKKIEINPDYGVIIHNNAVLTLEIPLEWGPTIGPIPLPDRDFVHSNQVCGVFRWHNAYAVDDGWLLQLVCSTEFTMDPGVCQREKHYHAADEICVSSQYAQHPRSLDSSGNPVVCEGSVIGMIVPDFLIVRQFSCLTRVLSISSVMNSLSDVCYGHPIH